MLYIASALSYESGRMPEGKRHAHSCSETRKDAIVEREHLMVLKPWGFFFFFICDYRANLDG